MGVLNFLTAQTTRQGEAANAVYRYPRSESEWQAHYTRLRAAYSMEPYSLAERQHWHLFEALDDSQKAIAVTGRLLRDFAFIIDTNADALFAGGLDLDLADAKGAKNRGEILAAGEGLWKRSGVAECLSTWAHNVCLGRCGLEVQLLPRAPGSLSYQAVLVAHPPETYTVIYDDQSRTSIVKVIVVDEFYDPADIDERGNVVDGARAHVYRREIDDTDTVVTLDGVEIAEQSGPHRAGVVPFVNLVFRATQEPEHGLSAAFGLEPALAMADSMFTQAHATGARFADPKIIAKGVDLQGSDAGVFGRYIQWPSRQGYDSSVGYLEPSMAGVKGVLETIDRLLEQSRATFPEFALFRAGSGASGEALRTLGQGFERKQLTARAGVLAGIARAVGIGVAMEWGEPFDESTRPFVVTAGPVLPIDPVAEVDTLSRAVSAGLMRRADAVRRLQVIGLVGAEHDPEEYAADAEEAVTAKARQFFKPKGAPNV